MSTQTKQSWSTIVRSVLAWAWLTPTALLLADAIIYPGFIETKLSLTLLEVFYGGLGLQIMSRVFFSARVSNNWHTQVCKAQWFLLPLTALLLVINFFTFENYTFGMFHIHPSALVLITALLSSFLLLFGSKQRYRQLQPYSQFSLPFLLLSLLFVVEQHYFHTVFYFLKGEDSVFEYLTCFFFFGAAATLSVAGWSLRHSKTALLKLLAVVLCTGGLVFFVAGGEEISWGQRLLGIETPEEIAKVNSQQEITIHNLDGIIEYVYYAYWIISVYCATAWIIPFVLKKMGRQSVANALDVFCPSPKLFGWFVPMLLYVPLRETESYAVWGHWEEMSEMFWSAGLLLHAIDVKKMIKRWSDNSI
ncbi:MAG: hypothetical protein H6774_02350 [Pseudomonadales bacterium]|nr:hypothetical protein [Candidatus Woesebacteria bacterium]MCB9801908.1 hypothetical protein [Pseudomonadales bacterium]